MGLEAGFLLSSVQGMLVIRSAKIGEFALDEFGANFLNEEQQQLIEDCSFSYEKCFYGGLVGG